MLKLSRNKIGAFLLLFLATLAIFSFQNCSKGAFNSSQNKVVDSYCGNASGCASSTQTSSGTIGAQVVVNDDTLSPTPTFQINDDDTYTNETLPPNPGPTITYNNFVAGSKASCEQAISTQMHITYSCSIGGGCGNCGPASTSCPSANPSLYGACIDSTTQMPMTAPSTPVVSSCKAAGFIVAAQNCQGGAMPRSETQSNTQEWSGCCSGNVLRTCAQTGASDANPIICL